MLKCTTAILPMPTIGLRSAPSYFEDPTEESQMRNGLEMLNNEAIQLGDTSKKLEQTLRNLQRLLNPEALTSL